MAEVKRLREPSKEEASELQVFIRKTNTGFAMNTTYGEGQRIGEVKPLKIRISYNNVSSGGRGRSDVPTEEPGKLWEESTSCEAMNVKRECQDRMLGNTS